MEITKDNKVEKKTLQVKKKTLFSNTLIFGLFHKVGFKTTPLCKN